MPRLKEFRWDAWAHARFDEFLWETKGGTEPIPVAVDTETEGVAFYDPPFGATLTWRGNSGRLRSAYIDLADEGREGRIKLLGDLLRIGGPWILHNAKFDMQKLLLVGAITWDDVNNAQIEDTQTIFHLLDENSRKALKHLAVTVLGIDNTIEVEVKSGPNKGTFKRVPKEEYRLAAVRRKLGLKKEDGYHLLPREVLIPYALKDTEFTLLLYEALKPRLEAKDEELQALYLQEMQLTKVLLRMEANGIALDIPYLNKTASVYGAKVMQGWGKVVGLTGNEDLNPQSPKQLTVEFLKRGIPLLSTNEATLKTLDDELARAILAYRLDKKMHTTYLSALQKEQRDGIVHPSFNATGAKTGRMSSGSAKE